MSDSAQPGVSIKEQYPAEADVIVQPDKNGAWPPTKLHRELFDVDRGGLGERLIEGVRSVGRCAESVKELYRVLDDAGVGALNGGYVDPVVGTAKGRSDDAHELVRVTRQLGGNTSGDVRTGFEDILAADPAVFAAADVTPTIAISMDGFAGVRREQREDILALVRAYATGCRVILVAGPIERTFLWRKHHEELPASVKDDCKPRLGEQANAAAVETAVAEARERFDADAKPVQLLRLLADENSDTLTYSALAAEMAVERGTIRNHVSQKLLPLGLVDRFDHLGDSYVSLTHIGSQFLSALGTEIGVQRTLSESVKDAGQAVHDSRVSPAPAHEGPTADGGGRGRHRLPERHQVRSLSRPHCAGTAAVARDGGVALADQPWDEADDRGEPGWYYDEAADRVVVSAEYDGPMQWWVCIARALTSPWTFRHILPAEAFEDDDSRLAELFDEFRHVMRDSRCVGYLDNAADGAAFVDELRNAEEHLCELTRRWRHREFDCSAAEFRSTVTREALGLASTMVHLLDLAGVDVVREARLPTYRKRDADDRRTLARSIAKGAAIQSTYGEFAGYRQLFEDREDKRERAIAPTVDAADPLGEVIGSFVVSGPGVGTDDDDLADRIRDEIDRMERHDDAPDFAIHVPVDERAGDRRRTTAQAARTACAAKHLSLTRQATSWCHAIAGTPWDAARALFQLGAETEAPGRDIRHHDVRYALSTLDADRLLPDAKPTIGAMLKTLLTADPDESLSNSQIEARGGPTARSIRRHADILEAFGILERTAAGWRLPETLAVATDDDRRPVDVVSDALATLVPERYADPDDPVGATLFGPPGERLPTLREAWPPLDPWIKMVRALCDEPAPPADPPTAMFGEPPTQASVRASMGVAG